MKQFAILFAAVCVMTFFSGQAEAQCGGGGYYGGGGGFRTSSFNRGFSGGYSPYRSSYYRPSYYGGGFNNFGGFNRGFGGGGVSIGIGRGFNSFGGGGFNRGYGGFRY